MHRLWPVDKVKPELARALRITDSRRLAQLLQVAASIDSLSEITATLCVDLGFDGFILQSQLTRLATG